MKFTSNAHKELEDRLINSLKVMLSVFSDGDFGSLIGVASRVCYRRYFIIELLDHDHEYHLSSITFGNLHHDTKLSEFTRSIMGLYNNLKLLTEATSDGSLPKNT